MRTTIWSSNLFDKSCTSFSMFAFPFWISLASVTKVGPNIKVRTKKGEKAFERILHSFSFEIRVKSSSAIVLGFC